jgi:hypothetical protein
MDRQAYDIIELLGDGIGPPLKERSQSALNRPSGFPAGWAKNPAAGLSLEGMS